jgi:hypothetical protein
MNHIDRDDWGWQERAIAAAIIALIILAFVGYLRGYAAPDLRPAAGNKGGCGQMGVALCTVMDAGTVDRTRFVSLACQYDSVPEKISTPKRWKVGTPVMLWGCIALDSAGKATVLTAPFTVSK